MSSNGSIVDAVRLAIEKLTYSELRDLLSVYSVEYKLYIYNKLKTDKEKAIYEQICL